MGQCNSCVAQDLDEVRFVDANYTPEHTILGGSTASVSKFRDSKRTSTIKVPVVKRKKSKRASTTHVQDLEFIAPILRQMTSHDSDKDSHTYSLPKYSDVVEGERAQSATQNEDDIQPTFPRVESLSTPKPAEQVATAGEIMQCLKCPEGHGMRRFSMDNLPEEYGCSSNPGGPVGAPRCDLCNKPDIHLKQYYHCANCDFDVCTDCANSLLTSNTAPNVENRQGDAGEFDNSSWLDRDQLKKFQAELSRTKNRLRENKKRVRKEEASILEDFAQSNHIFLTSSRKRAFMFLSKAFEIGYDIDRRILEDIYVYYSQQSGDINEMQMHRLLVELNKAFAQICEDAIKESKNKKRNGEKRDSFIDSAYIEELVQSCEIYKENVASLSTKKARKIRKRFGTYNHDGLITMEAFCENIGPILFEDQMNMTHKWKKVLRVETPEEFLEALMLGE